MSFGESLFYAAIMTLMDEIKNGESASKSINIPPSNNNIEIEFTFENLKVKDKLITMASELFSKADKACDTTTDLYAESLIPPLITSIIYECVDAINTDYETKRRIYGFAIDYCNVQSEFTWDVLHLDDPPFQSILFQLAEMTLDTIFVASTKGNGDAISSEFVRLISELMLHMEDAIIKQYTSITLPKRPLLVTLDKFIVAMEKEMHRMEEEDPSLKQETPESKETEIVTALRNDAREALNCEDMNRAAAYYRELLKKSPNDWEALIYSELCSIYTSPNTTNANKISDNTIKISNCIKSSIPLTKEQIFLRTELITELSNLASWVCKLATNYFVAAMNSFRASSGGSTANMSKTLQVSGIIHMMFALGDSIEETYPNDTEMIKNLSCSCWKIGFDCYENCNMSAPPKMYDHYLKMLKYNPSFRCSKPLTDGNSASGSGGCYVATAVYGSYDCPQVWTLRRFRDYKLAKSWFGRCFIRFYYATSPTFVRLFKNTKWFSVIIRKHLDTITNKLNASGYNNTPYSDKSIENHSDEI